MSAILPHFHFVHPSKKLTPEWCNDAINFLWHNTHNKSLLDGKNINKINRYGTGDIDMEPFKRMYKSLAKKMDNAMKNVPGYQPGMYDSTGGIDFSPLPMIPSKLDSAISLVQKTPVEIECKAVDALAIKKKKDDIDFLVNKPAMESDLQDFADKMKLGKIDLGATENSSVPFSDEPYGLDLTNPEELDLFTNLMYSLRVEASFEKVLQIFYNIKRMEQVRYLETKDIYFYGYSAHDAYKSSITGLPDAEYLYPGDVITQPSLLPDHSDNVARFITKRMSVLSMFNHFSDEITSMDKLDEIINGKKTGYCACSGYNPIHKNDFGSFQVDMVLCEVKTIDWVGVHEKPKSKAGFKYLTMDETQATRKIWGQNTIRFWWLKNTDYYFKIEKLPFSFRKRGLESFQNFSTNIYKAKEKSAVELCIGENEKAQIADIKAQHAIIASQPRGKVIDLKGIRGAVEAMANEPNAPTRSQLISLLFEKNVMFIDTDGYDGKNDGQLKPFYEIPGGIGNEIVGYYNVIAQCAANISRFTGINEQLAGQAGNTEGLIGMQKLLINSSINALNYVTEAIETQYQALFNVWANIIQSAIKEGGKAKEAIVNYIGLDDTNVIKGLDEVPIHNLSITIHLTQREEEREAYRQQLNFMKSQGVISTADEYQLSVITNPKEKMRFLAIKEVQWKKQQEAAKQADRDAMLQRQEIANTGLVQSQQAKTEGKTQEIYAKGEVDAKLMEMAANLNLTDKDLEFLRKKALQQDRGQDQLRKMERQIEKKEEVELQQPYTMPTV